MCGNASKRPAALAQTMLFHRVMFDERAASVNDNATFQQHSCCHGCTAGMLGLVIPSEVKLAELCLVLSSWPSSDGASCLWLRVYQECNHTDSLQWSCTKAFLHLGYLVCLFVSMPCRVSPTASSALAFPCGFWVSTLVICVSCLTCRRFEITATLCGLTFQSPQTSCNRGIC